MHVPVRVCVYGVCAGTHAVCIYCIYVHTCMYMCRAVSVSALSWGLIVQCINVHVNEQNLLYMYSRCLKNKHMFLIQFNSISELLLLSIGNSKIP